MGKKKAEEGGIDYTMIITDIPDTLDPEKFIPTNALPRNWFNSLTGKSVLGSTLCQNINLTSTRNCVETVPENYRPPGFDPQRGHYFQLT